NQDVNHRLDRLRIRSRLLILCGGNEVSYLCPRHLIRNIRKGGEVPTTELCRPEGAHVRPPVRTDMYRLAVNCPDGNVRSGAPSHLRRRRGQGRSELARHLAQRDVGSKRSRGHLVWNHNRTSRDGVRVLTRVNLFCDRDNPTTSRSTGGQVNSGSARGRGHLESVG